MLGHVERETGIERERGETPREYLHRVCDQLDCDSDQRDAAVAAVERAMFSPDPPTDQQVDTLLDHLRDADDSVPEQPEPSVSTDESGDEQYVADIAAPENGRPTVPDATPAPLRGEATSTTADSASRASSQSDTPVRHRVQSSVGTVSDSVRERISSAPAAAWAARFAPVAFVLPFLGTSVPADVQTVHETATSQRTVAIARAGFDAVGSAGAAEFATGLHLNAWLAAPLLGNGSVEGIRLVSALAALLTTVLVAAIARRLFGDTAAFVAPVLLWANPYFFRVAWTATPEATSVLLTTGVVAATLRYTQTGRHGDPLRGGSGESRAGEHGAASRLRAGASAVVSVLLRRRPRAGHATATGSLLGPGRTAYRWIGLGALVLAVAVLHTAWAAATVVPVASYLLLRKRRVEAVLTVGVAVAALAALAAATEFGTPEGYAVTATGIEIYLSPEWQQYWLTLFGAGPVRYAQGLLFFGGLVFAAYWLYWWQHHGGPGALLLGLWTVSGLVLPLALPGGSLAGEHVYLWGVVVPLTLTVAWLLGEGCSWGASSRQVSQRLVRNGVTAVLVCLAAVNALVVELGGL